MSEEEENVSASEGQQRRRGPTIKRGLSQVGVETPIMMQPSHNASCSRMCEARTGKASCTGCSAGYGPLPLYVVDRLKQDVKNHLRREIARQEAPLVWREAVRLLPQRVGDEAGRDEEGDDKSGGGAFVFIERVPNVNGMAMCKIQRSTAPWDAITVEAKRLRRPTRNMPNDSPTRLLLNEGATGTEYAYRVKRLRVIATASAAAK